LASSSSRRCVSRVKMSVNRRKQEQLGMPLGTASARLRRLILFRLVQRLGEDVCYRCGRAIETVAELSIEHKKPWFNVDPSLFWDPDNLAFSHLSCSAGSRRRGVERLRGKDGTEWCSGCKRFLSVGNFGRMNKKNYPRQVKYHCNECRKANGRERSKS
jgi:hypothetical protein